MTVTDVTMVNQPAGCSYRIHDCDDVRFDRIVIRARLDYPNNDGTIRNCTFSNLVMPDTNIGISIQLPNRRLPGQERASDEGRESTLIYRGLQMPQVVGRPDAPVHHIYFTDCCFEQKDADTWPDAPAVPARIKPHTFDIRCAQDVVLQNTTFSAE